VPWIVALRVAPASFSGPAITMRAFKMVVANLRPCPTWPMRWPTTDSGTHNVQRMRCGSPSVCQGGARPSVGVGGLAASGERAGWGHGQGHLGLCGGTHLAVRGPGHRWGVVAMPSGLCSTPFSLLTPSLQPVLSPSGSWLPVCSQ
jgi:hypothetical protein